jgi:hypothetical protein
LHKKVQDAICKELERGPPLAMVVDYFIPGNLYSFEELPDSAIGN